MTISCSQCDQSFELTSDDLAFYEKVSPVFAGKKQSIPPPTLCPDCRNQRRMAWRNDRTFFRRKCDATGELFLSIYPEGTPFPVYKPSAWYSDTWNPLDFGRPFDFSRPFFDQWKELFDSVPRLGIDIVNCENSEYCNYCGDEKNCYLDIAGEGNEDCYFNLFTKHSKNCVDCTFVYTSTLCYESIQCYDCYNVRYSQYVENCSDCEFCFDLKGCRNCLLSTNLRNKEFYILNQPHTKEEYAKKRAELNLGTLSAVQSVYALWEKMRIENGIYRDKYSLNSENCTGNDIKNAKNCRQSFNISGCEDSAYLQDVLDAKDCQDLNYSLYKPEVAYELISTLQMHSSAFSMASHYCNSAFYCDLCNNSENVFGCIGLNHGKYCILNRQYTQGEYEELVPKIIEHMKAAGEWGEFFPGALSPFGYNETVAQEYYPLTQEEAGEKSFSWRESSPTEMQQPTLSIPDSIHAASSGIVKEIFGCTLCNKSFRIIAQEFSYYKNQEIPPPSACPACRHTARNARRNPRRLWDRSCAECSQAIQTSYSLERPEKVYCEKCYLKRIY